MACEFNLGESATAEEAALAALYNSDQRQGAETALHIIRMMSDEQQFELRRKANMLASLCKMPGTGN